MQQVVFEAAPWIPSPSDFAPWIAAARERPASAPAISPSCLTPERWRDQPGYASEIRSDGGRHRHAVLPEIALIVLVAHDFGEGFAFHALPALRGRPRHGEGARIVDVHRNLHLLAGVDE